MITFQNIILKLIKYWNKYGCTNIQSLDLEVGAATFHPNTFFGAIQKKDIFYSYIQLCRRAKDAKYGNLLSIKLSQYYQFQVINKPSLKNIKQIYVDSLIYLGIDINKNELKFIEDNWENSTLGAYGYGWEVWLNGVEISQFTYFQEMGNIICNPILVEITYGVERLLMHLQKILYINDLIWNIDSNNKIIRYYDIISKYEYYKSIYIFNKSNIKFLIKCINQYEEESLRLLKFKNPLWIISYENALKMVNYFNLLDCKNYFSDIERKNMILNIRNLFCLIAKISLKV